MAKFRLSELKPTLEAGDEELTLAVVIKYTDPLLGEETVVAYEGSDTVRVVQPPSVAPQQRARKGAASANSNSNSNSGAANASSSSARWLRTVKSPRTPKLGMIKSSLQSQPAQPSPRFYSRALLSEAQEMGKGETRAPFRMSRLGSV